MNSLGTVYRRNSDGTITSLVGPEGYVIDPTVARNTYLANAFQRISYSFHQQGGILASLTTKPTDFLTVTAGGEFRSWTADHPVISQTCTAKRASTSVMRAAIQRARS
jgi:hypothetical protein